MLTWSRSLYLSWCDLRMYLWLQIDTPPPRQFAVGEARSVSSGKLTGESQSAICFRITFDRLEGNLEDELAAKPPLPLAAAAAQSRIHSLQRSGNLPEIGVVNVCSRVTKVWSIRNSESVGLELEAHPFGDLEGAEHVQIKIKIPGASNNIAAGVAENAGSGHVREIAWVQIVARQVSCCAGSR